MAEYKKKRRKTGGREKGTPNKITKEIKDKIAAFVVGNFDNLVETMNEIENPKEKAELFIKLIKYVVPVQQKVDLDGELKIGSIDVQFRPTGIQPKHDEEEFLDD